MEDIVLRFTSKWPYNPTSWLVARLAGSSQFSHTMCIIDGLAYEATMLHGCRVVPLQEAMQDVAIYQDMFIPVPNLSSAQAFGQLQDGKKYDFLGAFGIPFLMSEDWEDWSKWWCSELTFMQVLAGGTTMLDPDVQHRVTPNDLYNCNYTKSELAYTDKFRREQITWT